MKHLCLFVLSAFAATAAPGADLLIEPVTVISPEQSQPLADRNVLIRDGRTVSVSQQAVTARSDTRKIDGRGKFLTPGIMDSHVHASDSAGIPPLGNDPELVALRGCRQESRQQPFEAFCIIRFEAQARIGNELRQCPAIRRDHGYAHRHGLEHRHSESLCV